MRGHDDGGAGAVDPVEQLHDADAGLRVEVAGGLVGDQQHRPVDERAGDRDALLLTAGELAGQAVLLAVQADELEHLGHDRARSRARDLPMTSSANATFSATVLFGSSRKSWKTVPTWRRSAGTFQLDSRARSLPSTCTRPGGRLLLAQHQPQEGRLARAGLADEEDELALLDLERDVLQGRAALGRVQLGDVVEPDHEGTIAVVGRPGWVSVGGRPIKDLKPGSLRPDPSQARKPGPDARDPRHRRSGAGVLGVTAGSAP